MQEYYDVMKQAKHNEEQLGVWEAAHAGIPYSNTRGIPREHFFFFFPRRTSPGYKQDSAGQQRDTQLQHIYNTALTFPGIFICTPALSESPMQRTGRAGVWGGGGGVRMEHPASIRTE